MATTKMTVNVMDVGQGQGTFVEVYDGGVLTNTLLFDLGSAKSSVTAGGSTINYITDKIKSMAVPKIDYMSLSHKDKDHVNLVMKLITAIDAAITPKKLVIGKVRYGGSKAWYSNDLITQLGNHCKDIDSLGLKYSCYTAPSTWDPIWNVNDVFVYIFLANVPSDETATTMMDLGDDPDSELANCVSIISSVWWNGNQFFINGDATFVTFQEFNTVYASVPSFNNPQMVTLPHHGSRKTTLGLSSSTDKASAPSTAVVNQFAKRIGAKTVTGSAETYGNYHHPSYDIITLFNQYAEKGAWWSDPGLDPGRHYLSAYLDQTFTDVAGGTLIGTYKSFETEINVYTTLYCEPRRVGLYLAPPINPIGNGTAFPVPQPIFAIGMQWVFTVDSARKTTLTAIGNRDAPLIKTTMVEVQEPTNIKVRTRKFAPSDAFSVKPPISLKHAALKSLKSYR
jgi:hypothetical protein